MPDPAPQSAYVGSSDAIVDLRAAIHTFVDEVTAALESVHQKSGKACRWLDEDAPAYWRSQEQRSFDAVAAARTALTICKTKTVAGHRSSCLEEKVALRKAQDRLELCKVQRGRTRAASLETHAAVDDFRAQVSALERFLESDIPKALAVLHRTSVSLDAYTATRPSRPRPRDDGSTDEPSDDGGTPVHTAPNDTAPNDTAPNNPTVERIA